MPVNENLGRAVLDLATDNRELNKGLDKAGKRIDKFSARIGKVGTRMTAAITAPITAIGGAMLKASSDLQESVNAVNVVFGDSAQIIERWGRTAAQQAGLSQAAFNEAATTIGAALQNAGLAADEAAHASIDLTQRAADLASVFNTDVKQALGAIQAGLRGEVDPLERFGVAMNQAAVEAKALEMGLIDANEEMTAGQKTAARMQVIMEQTAQVAGDFGRTSNDLANGARVLKADLQNLAAQWGQALLPTASRFVEVARRVTTVLGGLSEESRALVMRIAGIAAAIGPTLIALSGLIKGFRMVGTAFKTIGTLIAGTWPWGILIAAVVGITVIVIRNWEEIKAATQNLWETLKSIFSNLKNGLVDMAKAIGLGIAGRFMSTFDRIGKMFRDFGSKAIDTLRNIFRPRRIAEIWSEGITDAFSDSYDAAGNELVKRSEELGESAKRSFSDGFGEIGELASRGFSAVKDATVDVGDSLRGVFEGGTGAVGGLIEEVRTLTRELEATGQGMQNTGAQAEEAARKVAQAGEAARKVSEAELAVGRGLHERLTEGRGTGQPGARPRLTAGEGLQERLTEGRGTGQPGRRSTPDGGGAAARGGGAAARGGATGADIGAMIGGGLESVAKALLNVAGKVLNAFKSALTGGELFQALTDKFNAILSEELGPAANALVNMLLPFLPTIREIAAVVNTVLVDVFEGLREAFIALQPGIQSVSIVIEAIGGLLKELAPTWQMLFGIVSDLLVPVFSILASVIRVVTPVIGILGEFMQFYADTVLAKLVIPVMLRLAAFIGALADRIAWVRGIVKDVFTAVANAIRNVVTLFQNIVDNPLNSSKWKAGTRSTSVSTEFTGRTYREHLRAMQEQTGDISDVDTESGDTGLDTGSGGGGRAAQYQQQRPITINVYASDNNFVGLDGGVAEFTKLIDEELSALSVLRPLEHHS